jgi:hypothetical protein
MEVIEHTFSTLLKGILGRSSHVSHSSGLRSRKYKETTRVQWQETAEAWHRWTPTITAWLGPATDKMLDLAGIGPVCACWT